MTLQDISPFLEQSRFLRNFSMKLLLTPFCLTEYIAKHPSLV